MPITCISVIGNLLDKNLNNIRKLRSGIWSFGLGLIGGAACQTIDTHSFPGHGKHFLLLFCYSRAMGQCPAGQSCFVWEWAMGIKTEILICDGVRRLSECTGEDWPICLVLKLKREKPLGLNCEFYTMCSCIPCRWEWVLCNHGLCISGPRIKCQYENWVSQWILYCRRDTRQKVLVDHHEHFKSGPPSNST